MGLPIECCQVPVFIVLMNSIIWNCRGASKPSFQKRVREMVQKYNPAILVVMETRVGVNRAREITERLSFDGAIHTDTIGCCGIQTKLKFPICPVLNKKFTSRLRYEFQS